ncbi:AAA family ATPase [Ignavibacterium sp.]|uniref:AAA family ATPase n=1 Tax=Ignavibacterium sp. TaxID=2651167 RepID=UPI00307FCDEA
MNNNYSEIEKEVTEHLQLKRYKLALITAKKLVDTFPDNPNSHALLAFSLLENLNPFLALDTINYAVEISSNSPEIRLQRASVLYRLSIYDGALVDCNFYLTNSENKDLNAVILKIKIIAASERFFEALELIDDILKHNPDNENLNLLFTLIKTSLDTTTNDNNSVKDIKYFIELCKLSNEQKYFWFTNFVYKKSVKEIHDDEFKNQLKLLNLVALVSLFRVKEAELLAEEIKNTFFNNASYIDALDKIKLIKKNRANDEKPVSIKKVISETELVKSSDSNIEVLSARFFDLSDSISSGKRKYLLQFDENILTYIAIELLLKNPFHKKENRTVPGTAIWYLNHSETGRNNFQLEFKSEWETIEFVQSWGTELPGFWKSGEGKVEIILDEKNICSRKFLIGDSEIINIEETEKEYTPGKLIKSETSQPEAVDLYTIHKSDSVSLENLLNELYEFIGLDNLKQSLIDFLTYLNFISERKKKGIKTEEKLELHCLFLGNPGTGKTSVARLFGKILKAMGVLENGHVIEVDRAGLVGQYIGETAIKTDKIISEAIGGILFIDEAYSLKKANTSSDFGQEAIDILLKRMEDFKGKFIVIAAGYPELMNEFIESNPGLKSRFTHTFYFDDYTPAQLLQIFKLFASKEEYELENSAEDFLLKQFSDFYKNRDKSFGNARLVRKIFSETKIQLSKRYQAEQDSEKSNFHLNKIKSEDLRNALLKFGSVISSKETDSRKVNLISERINQLVGLDNFKNEMNEIIKLARYYSEEGENLTEKINSNFIFAGKNFAGQNTSAKLLSELFYELRIILRNELHNYNVRQFVGNDIHSTIEKSQKIFDRAKGAVIFIKDFDFIFEDKSLNDTCVAEFINILSQRLQTDAGKTIVVIETSYNFPANIPSGFSFLKTFFNKKIVFDDFTPDELLEIFNQMLRDKKLFLSSNSSEVLRKFFFHVYRNKEKYPPNTLLLKNILDIILRKHLLRIADIPKDKRNDEINKTISENDIEDLIKSEKSKETSSAGEYTSSLRKHLDQLDKLAGLKEVKQTIFRIIDSEKVAAIRKERGLNVLPRNFHGLFVGTGGTGKSTIANIYANILFDLGNIKSNLPLELDRLTIKNYFSKRQYFSSEFLLNEIEGKLIVLNNAGQLAFNEEVNVREFFESVLSLLKTSGDKFVLVLSDIQSELNRIMSTYPELKNYFSNNFYFKNFNPREMLEITLNFTEQFGYQLDEGAWQLLLDIFNDLYSLNEENGNTKTVLDLVFRAITIQEMRLSKKESVSDEELMTITIEDISKLI